LSKKKVKKAVKWNVTEPGGFLATSGLTSAVVQLLLSPEVQKINFILNAQIVNGARYREVAKAIQDFYIVVFHDTKFVKAPGSDSGFYSCVDDALYLGFKNLNSFDNKMLTLHECTHAIGDQYGTPNRLDFECSGYLASAMYYRHCGNKWPKRLKADNAKVDAVYLAAANLADAMLDKVVNYFPELNALRSALQAISFDSTAAKDRVTTDGFTHTVRAGTWGIVTNYFGK
jgi:hypothetical protein